MDGPEPCPKPPACAVRWLMAKHRKSGFAETPLAVGLLLLLSGVSCFLVVVLHRAGSLDQAAQVIHRLPPAEPGGAAQKARTKAPALPPRKGLSAVIAVPGGRLAPSPCGEKGGLLAKSVEALLESSSELIEIIVVEDGSNPPLPRPDLTGMAWEDLKLPRREEPSELWQGVRLLWLRLEAPQGAAAARAMGGDAARGEALAFFDCYVKPQTGWAAPILELLRQRPKAVALPALDDLDAASWETSGSPRFFDNVFTWEAETVQLYFDKERVTWPHPIDQGNVMVFSWSFWQHIGGYDRMMKGSSTLLIENIELSLRVLLCGGSFAPVAQSVVGFCHKQHGTLHHEREDMIFNQARIIEAWFGPWASEAQKDPRFADYLLGARTVGDLSEIRSLQENLQCAGLEQFLDTFRVPLEILGLLPGEVYFLREESTGLCLQEWSKDDWVLSKCDDTARGQLFTGKNELEGDGDGRCCSGLGPAKALLGSNSFCRGSPWQAGAIWVHPSTPSKQPDLVFAPRWSAL
ncbi:unnamed protein product [Effrenium voratum]|nr:unnamed protein product [Effrenium voratum]